MRYFTLLMAVFISSCSVSNDTIQEYIALCESNGGLNRVNAANVFQVQSAVCNNGAFFNRDDIPK